jgi:hypothetical protein
MSAASSSNRRRSAGSRFCCGGVLIRRPELFLGIFLRRSGRRLPRTVRLSRLPRGEKIAAPPSAGLPCELDEVATHRLDGKPLRDHQRHIIRWGVEGGRRAYFLDFGLGKSTIQVETGRIILEKAAR